MRHETQAACWRPEAPSRTWFPIKHMDDRSKVSEQSRVLAKEPFMQATELSQQDEAAQRNDELKGSELTRRPSAASAERETEITVAQHHCAAETKRRA